MTFFSLVGRRGDLLSPTPGDRHPQMRLAHIVFWKSKIKKFHIDPLVTETFPGYVEAFLDLFATPRNKTPLKKQTKKQMLLITKPPAAYQTQIFECSKFSKF